MRKILMAGVFLLTLACNKEEDLEAKYRPVDYKKSEVIIAQSDAVREKLPEKKAIYAVIETDKGNLILELFDQDAPKTVQNFVDLAQGNKETMTRNGRKVKKRFYDGLTFHRVIENFMIQGGCPNGDGTGGPGYTFEDEINAKSLGLDKKKVSDPPQYYQGQLQRVVLREMGINGQSEFDAKREEFQKKYEKEMGLSVMEVLYRVGYRYNEVLTSHKAVRGSLAMANAGPNTNGSQFFINQVETPHLNGLHTVFGQLIEGYDVVDKIVASGNGNTTIQRVAIVDRREQANGAN